jgi:hypothetical protein
MVLLTPNDGNVMAAFAQFPTVNHYRKWRDNSAQRHLQREDLREASLRR